MMRDAWFKAATQHSALGTTLKMYIPHDVFSTQRIDEGTSLLLMHLPQREPSWVLDMGCGYGALGLPIAARFPASHVEMVDRDLLAVKWAAINARENGLTGVEIHGSLGFRDLRSDHRFYDWILCNVPARIGRPFIEHLLTSGRARLNPDGELRIVVINDLIPVLHEITETHHGSPVEVVHGPRHSIFSFSAASGNPIPENPDLYLRDQVEIQGLRLDRPYDLGGDDPRRLAQGLPVLLDALPRDFKGKVLCFRCGYGQLPLTSRARWPEARVVAIDRDLLATTFVRRNAEKLRLNSEALEVRESVNVSDALRPGERFDLILGELSPSAGKQVAEVEIQTIVRALASGGQALILSLQKLAKEWIKPFAALSGMGLHPLLSREGYVVISIRGS